MLNRKLKSLNLSMRMKIICKNEAQMIKWWPLIHPQKNQYTRIKMIISKIEKPIAYGNNSLQQKPKFDNFKQSSLAGNVILNFTQNKI